MNEIAITKNSLPRVVIIGAGFAGLNLVKALEHKPVQIILIDQNNHHQFLPLLYQVAISGLEPDSVVSPVRKLFKSCNNMIFRMANVEVMLKARVKDYDGQTLIVDTPTGTDSIQAGALIWTAGVNGNALGGINSELIIHGNRIQVDEYNQIRGMENVFAIGDIASMAIIGKKDAVAGFKNKVAVALSWVIKYSTYDKANQLIIRKYSPGKNIYSTK